VLKVSLEVKDFKHKRKEFSEIMIARDERAFEMTKQQSLAFARKLRLNMTREMQRNLGSKHFMMGQLETAKYLVSFKKSERKAYGKDIRNRNVSFTFVNDFPLTWNNGFITSRIEYGYPLSEKGKIGGTLNNMAFWVLMKAKQGTQFYIERTREGKAKEKVYVNVDSMKVARRIAFPILYKRFGKRIKNPAKNWYVIDLEDMNLKEKYDKIANMYWVNFIKRP